MGGDPDLYNHWLDEVSMMILPILAAVLVGSPNCRMRVVDQSGAPMAGLRIVREWQTSEEKKGASEALTDTNGVVRFTKIETSISAARKVFKPLLVFVPAACGPSWEIYGMTTFHVYSPKNYEPQLDQKIWKRDHEVWVRKDKLCIRDPAEIRKYHADEHYQEIYFFNFTKPFDFTLQLYKSEKSNPNGPANGSQPFRSETDSPSSAAGSRR